MDVNDFCQRSSPAVTEELKERIRNLDKEVLIKQIVNGVPHLAIAKKPGEVGRPRYVPKTFVSHKEMKQLLGVKIKDMTPEQKRTYNRLAQRKTYAKKQAIELSGETASQYKNKLGKTIKQMTKEEKAKYNRLSKREQRLRK